MTWKKPAALVFGGSDPFIGLKSAFNFLESKRCGEQCDADGIFAAYLSECKPMQHSLICVANRTCMTILQLDAKLGHMPQEDYAEALQKPIVTFLEKSDK